eukprot:1140104-Pelagomonas_calceolata.AAC.7
MWSVSQRRQATGWDPCRLQFFALLPARTHVHTHTHTLSLAGLQAKLKVGEASFACHESKDAVPRTTPAKTKDKPHDKCD